MLLRATIRTIFALYLIIAEFQVTKIFFEHIIMLIDIFNDKPWT